jgi:hypothetical protein
VLKIEILSEELVVRDLQFLGDLPLPKICEGESYMLTV